MKIKSLASKILKSHWLVLILFVVLGVIFYKLIFNKYMFGTTLDWVNQHVAIPEYFRNLFYKYKILLPQFTFHIGTGQNFFNLAYHGLLSPWILLSYLLPFISMVDYISLVGFISFILIGFLMYYWLIINSYSKKVAICVALIAMFSGPISFHAHRHYMFISFIPFVIFGLIGIDYYFKKQVKSLFIIGVALSILTSFFYMPSFSMVFFIYTIYKYLLEHKILKIKDLFHAELKIGWMYIIGVLISCALIVPVIITILSNRGSINSGINIKTLFFPNFNLGYMLYNPYNMGLILLAVMVLLINLFNKNKAIQFLSITIFTIISIPFLLYIMNGLLYVRPKVLIPFIPLMGLLIAYTLDNFKTYPKKNILSCITIAIAFIAIEFSFRLSSINILLVDLIVTVIVLLSLLHFKNKKIVYIIFLLPLIMISSSAIENKKENFLTKDYYISRTGTPDLIKLINETTASDNSFYRFNNLINNTYYTPNKIYNMNYYTTSIYSSNYSKEYNRFLHDEINISHSSTALSPFLNTNNVLFQTFMGVKYVASHNNKEGIGYTKISEKDGIYIAKNDNVFSIGFSNNNVISYDQFNSLNYPARQEALLNYIIIDNDKITNTNYLSHIEEYHLDISEVNIPDNLIVKKINDRYQIEAKANTNMTIKLNKPLNNKVLFIEFDIYNEVACPKKMMIGINNIHNTLSCETSLYYNHNKDFHYAVSSGSGIIDTLEISFVPAIYEIGNIRFYTLDYKYVQDSVNKIDKFIVDTSSIKHNYLKGNINVTNDGWFTMTIPYDRGFNIKVDNNKIDYQKVNTAFIGFKINKGSHTIELEYHASGYNLGIILTIIGTLLLILTIRQDYKLLKRGVKS
ncbi:MAG: YfhO family protein [Bacilli bacterium]